MAKSISIKDELERAKLPFTDGEDNFQERRKAWDKVVFRNLPTKLPPELTGAQEGLDYQTPEVKKAVFDWVNTLVMNPTTYNVVTLDQSADAKKAGRDIMLWTARGWEHEDEGRWWDRAVGEGQIRHGVKVMALRWDKQVEPESKATDTDEGVEESIDRIAEYESSDKEASDSLKTREESFKRKRHPFHWVDCTIYGAYWIGDERREEGPDVAYYQYEIPYVEAQRLYSQPDKKFSLDNLGKIAWIGEGEEEVTSQLDKVSVVIRDGRKLDGSVCPLPECDHPQRSICIYVSSNKDTFDEENLVDEIDSPFPGCSYFIIGGFVMNETNPHKRFNPPLEPLYVEATWQNYLNTLLATIGRTDYSDEFYVDMSKVPPHVQLPEGGFTQTYEKGVPGEISSFPATLTRYPKSMSPHMMALLQQSEARLQRFLMNRFLSGTAYTEASNATASAFKTQYQQAALPFNALLSESDKAMLRSWRYKYHAVKYFALSEPPDAKSKYYAIMTGSEKVRTSAKAGEVVWVDSDKLNLDFDLQVLTKSETLAEEEQRWFLASDKYAKGVYGPDDLLRDAGIDDIEGQKEKLRATYLQEDLDPLLREATKQMLIQKFSVMTGFDLGALVGKPVFAPQAPGGMQPMDQAAQEPVPGAGNNPVVNTNNALKTPGNNGMNVGPPSGVTGGSSPVR